MCGGGATRVARDLPPTIRGLTRSRLGNLIRNVDGYHGCVPPRDVRRGRRGSIERVHSVCHLEGAGDVRLDTAARVMSGGTRINCVARKGRHAKTMR